MLDTLKQASRWGSRRLSSMPRKTYTEQFGVTQPMGAIGTSADNSLAKWFNASMKGGLRQNGSAFPSQLLCRRDVFRWCPRSETRRLYSRCGYRSPNAFEAAGLATLTIASRRNARVRFPGASSKSAGYSYRSSALFTRCFTVLCGGPFC